MAMRACDQCSIFSTGGKFHPDYGLLLALHALTLVTRSYALLTKYMYIAIRHIEYLDLSCHMPLKIICHSQPF